MASLFNLNIESSCSLTQSPQPDSIETVPLWLSPDSLLHQNLKNMSAKGSRFFSGSEWRPESGSSSALPLRQPYIAAQATSKPGFGNRNPNIRTPQPSLSQYLGTDARVPPSQITGAPQYSGGSFPTFSTENRDPDGPVCSITSAELNACHGFALHRGGNVYTRLIPADRLPLLCGVPQTQGPEGLIVLPNTRGMSPSNLSSLFSDETFQFVPSVIGNGRPISKPSTADADLVQTRIDRIVTTAPPATQKKVKTYCAKWLHDGTCAFTQQGCRFKHEMPMDRATQLEVGLFNGLPTWYRRAQAADLRMGTNLFANSGISVANGGNGSDFNRGSSFGNNGTVPVRRGTTIDNRMSWRGGNAERDLDEPRLAYQPFENMPTADESRALTIAGGPRSWVLAPSAAAPNGYSRDFLYRNRLEQADANDAASRNAYNTLYQDDDDKDDGRDEV